VMSEDWSRTEVEAVVSEYLDMLTAELRGESVNKAERNRLLQPLLNERSRGSIEFKHQNISAVLIELGSPYIEGYKPRLNYQELLRMVVFERLSAAQQLQAATAHAVDEPAGSLAPVADLLTILVDPPSPDPERRATYEELRLRRLPTPPAVNWLEREARNRTLAAAGEQLVLRFEHERLWRMNRRTLAERIEHVSQTRGDGAGFDVLSYETDGRERLIEVKTTRFGAMTPFFASRNEVALSEERSNFYQLYRLYDFRHSPRLYQLPGSLRTTCLLEPVQYQASVA
jgi:hypothetical protein